MTSETVPSVQGANHLKTLLYVLIETNLSTPILKAGQTKHHAALEYFGRIFASVFVKKLLAADLFGLSNDGKQDTEQASIKVKDGLKNPTKLFTLVFLESLDETRIYHTVSPQVFAFAFVLISAEIIRPILGELFDDRIYREVTLKHMLKYFPQL